MAPNLTCVWITLLQLMSLALADVSHLDYSIAPSTQLGYYHYPAPNRPAVQRSQRNQYQQNQQYPQVARQFAEPALEHAAFTQALTSQGYVARVSAAAGSATGRSISSASVDANSLNLKLPVPFGIAPLNVAQLPLQAGAPYASVPRTTGLTSYGTPQIQRR
ncbi:GD12494 [Drosophila simulans]|uniref:GD12494 n=1 Tax=Drosophila simulans TaxID=7240 RepID=B4QMB0_DROSI|nr:GD12494 [Drosophila simulans]